MRTLLLIAVFAFSLQAFSQQKKKDLVKCEEYPSHIDSMYYMKWNSADSIWFVENIRHYSYIHDDLTKLLLLNGSSRDSVWMWQYFYNNQGLNDLDILSEWENEVSLLSQKKESVFTSDGLKINESVSTWKNNNWVPGSYWIYEYSEGLLSKVTYQLRRKDGSLYDYQYRYYIYENGLLKQVKFERVSDGAIINIQEYSYNERNKVDQILYLKLGASTAQLIPDSRRTYFYNSYGLNSSVLFELWDGTQWNFNYNYVYYYRIDQAKKVAVCQNGSSICVSKNAVPALLANGATLGRCEVEKARFKKAESSVTIPETGKVLKVYPNPVTDAFSIGGSSQAAFHLQLYNSTGSLVMSQTGVPSEGLTISRGNLPAGIYTLIITDGEFRQTERLLFK